MAKIFKGFKQVSAQKFNEEQDKAGYLWFVRTEVHNGEGENSVLDDSYDIYFGSKQYGHFRAGEIDAIRTSIETLGGNVDAILETLETLTGVVEANSEAIKENKTAHETNAKAIEDLGLSLQEFLVKNVKADDKVLNVADGILSATIDLKYADNRISLLGKEGKEIAGFDASVFVKDSVLEDVDVVTRGDEKYIVFTWKTEGESTKTDEIKVSDFVTLYDAGNGLSLDKENNELSIKIKEGENLLVADADGLGFDKTALFATTDTKYDAAGAADAVKDYADKTFVKKEGYVAFTDAMKTKLDGIAEGAQVNVVESVKVNGVEATVTGKAAEVQIEADDIKLGTAITTDGAELKEDESNLKYSADAKLSVVLQSIYTSIKAADAGGVKSVTAEDASVEVNSNDINNPTIKVKVSADANNLLTVKDDGMFVAMYYDGDDAE